MSSVKGSQICLCGFKHVGLLSRWSAPASSVARCQQPVREHSNKHYDPKWRRQRAMKFLKIDLPDWQKLKAESQLDPDEMRAHLQREGITPQRTFQEREIIISSTNTVFEAYVPPEGDGRRSVFSGSGVKQNVTELEKKGKSYLQLRKIRQFDPDFETRAFADTAHDIYVSAHQLLEDITNNEARLHELVTEKAFPEMTHHLEKKSVRWEFIESLESPRVVHVRTTTVVSKDNLYAQVTVRFHTKQSLAIYDRFGRLMYGGEQLVRDCLEYIVFEKHLSDEYGTWRLHSKVIPDWLPARDSLLRTSKKMQSAPRDDDKEDNEDDNKSQVATA